MKESAVQFKLLVILCFQLIIIVLLALFSKMLLKRISDSSANILKNNLASIEYCANMNRALSALRSNPGQLQSRTEFESSMNGEFDAVFEIGEKEIADAVKQEYFQWLSQPSDTTVFRTLRANLRSINEMNISAMRIKEMDTQEIADHASTYIIVISVLVGISMFLFTYIFIGRQIRQ